ncbi:MAG TPA: hypothetical protein VKR52_07290 [Terracidiphilus sp.]|nr:hypothetical protein [Terracidiphilus sp.]
MMLDQFEMWAKQAIEFAFFIGLVGCTCVVLLSWISILKDGFSND